jgi:hypothetical protein
VTRRLAARASFVAGALAVTLAVTACGSSTATPVQTQAAASTPTAATAATPTAAPTPAPTPSPTPTPTPTTAATPTPTYGTATDPAAGLAIASPYTLGATDASTASLIKSVLKGSMGAATYAKVHVGLRSASSGGKLVGYVMVVRFAPGTLTDAAYAALLNQMAVNSKITLTTSTVSGRELALGKLMGVYLGGYHNGDDAIMAIAPTSADVVPIAQAIIAANG